MLHGTTVRSTIPRGQILSIRHAFDTRGFTIADSRDIPGRNVVALIVDDQPCLAEKEIRHAFDTRGFTIADCRDIPGKNVVALIVDDQPCLAEKEIRHAAEPILLLAHEDKEKLLSAKVEIEYRQQEPVYDPDRSEKTFKEIRIEKGTLDAGFRAAGLVVEGEYRVGLQEQLYIETNGVIAVPENGGVTLYGSMQCPYYVHKALKVLLNLPGEKVRVVQTETGGGFGGKEEYPSMIAGHAAILALKAGRPVKIIYDRVEDMLATTKRHPGVIRHRTGVAKDGRLTAIEIESPDGGAYVTLSLSFCRRRPLRPGRPATRCGPPGVAMTNALAPSASGAAGAVRRRGPHGRIAEALGMDPSAW
jgi:xanthine dehydrogenase molybdopterin-binding subunit B